MTQPTWSAPLVTFDAASESLTAANLIDIFCASLAVKNPLLTPPWPTLFVTLDASQEFIALATDPGERVWS